MVAEKGCTHSELIARVTALEVRATEFEKLMNERDKRYAERAKAQDDAVKLAHGGSREIFSYLVATAGLAIAAITAYFHK